MHKSHIFQIRLRCIDSRSVVHLSSSQRVLLLVAFVVWSLELKESWCSLRAAPHWSRRAARETETWTNFTALVCHAHSQGRSASLGFWSSKPSGFVSVLNQWFSSGFASQPKTLNSLCFVTELHLKWSCLHNLIFVFTWFVTFYIILMLRANQEIVRNVNYKNGFIRSDIVVYDVLKVIMLTKNIW